MKPKQQQCNHCVQCLQLNGSETLMEQHANLWLKHGPSKSTTCLYNKLNFRTGYRGSWQQQSRHLGIQDVRLKAKESRLEGLCL